MPYQDDDNLTSLPTAKKWLNIPTLDTAADDLLNLMIPAAGGWFRRMTGRPNIIATSITEVYSQTDVRNNWPQFTLWLRNYPILSISSVSIGSTSIPAYTGSGSGYSISGNVMKLYGFHYNWRLPLTVVYSTGYTALSTEAKTIEIAVLQLLKWWWTDRQHGDQVSQSLGQQITAKFSEDAAPPEVMQVVERFKRRVPYANFI